MPVNLETIRDRYREGKRGKKKWPSNIIAGDFLYPSYEIAEKAYKAKYKKQPSRPTKDTYKAIVAGNFVVNCVISIEIFFKQVILQNRKWDDEGLNALLKNQTITLNQAHDMFSREKITREYIVSHYYSFQNLSSISFVFNKLTNSDFFSEIENFQIDWWQDNKPTCLLEQHPNWRRDLGRMYEIRNRFVHDGILEPTSLKNLEYLFDLVFNFHMNVDEFLDHKYAIRLQEYLKYNKRKAKLKEPLES